MKRKKVIDGPVNGDKLVVLLRAELPEERDVLPGEGQVHTNGVKGEFSFRR